MKLYRYFILAIAFFAEAAFGAQYTMSTLDKGHRLLLENGLQITAFVNHGLEKINADLWRQSNFTMPLMGGAATCESLDALTTARWGGWAYWSDFVNIVCPASGPTINFPAKMYTDRILSIQYRDEQDLNTNAAMIATKDWFLAWKNFYPHALMYTNQYGGQITWDRMKTYMRLATPDMLMFDTYLTTTVMITNGYSPVNMYAHMAKYRELGLLGNAWQTAPYQYPIPYGRYLDAFQTQPYWMKVPSDSQMRLDQFASWTFGYKFVTVFTYGRSNNCDTANTCCSTLFDNADPGQPFDQKPNERFYQIAETNRQSRNLGPALVRLLSTGVYYNRGMHKNCDTCPPEANHNPSGTDTDGVDRSYWMQYFPDWSQGAGGDPYLKAIVSVQNLNPNVNYGLRGDLLIGYFKPLLQEDGNDLYFMITNGLNKDLNDGYGTNVDALVENTKQRIVLEFDFGASGINSLVRLSRLTGRLEIVPLTHVSGTVYRLDFTLPGGTGDLFKYNNGIPWLPSMVYEDCTDIMRSGGRFEADISGQAGAPDCKVNLFDLAALASDWMECYGPGAGNCL